MLAVEMSVTSCETHWSDSCYPIDLGDGSPRQVGDEVLLQCFVALRHSGLLLPTTEVRTV